MDPTPAHGMRDYVEWHAAYDDPKSRLSVRLRHVQRAISDWLDRTPGPVRVLSSCAGQGHDILGVLEQRIRTDRQRVHGALIELDPTNASIARQRIADLDVAGNISAPDIKTLINTSRQFCASTATVIWTRGNQEPDLGSDIRGWFVEAGFDEVSCQEWIEGTGMRVGVNRLVAQPETLMADEPIFTFYR